jgi:hypothetical protein
MIRTLIFASIMLVSICGCSGDSKPANSYVKDITSLCSLQSSDSIRIYDIRQINGVKKVIDGRDIYDLEFDATVEFLDKLWWDESRLFAMTVRDETDETMRNFLTLVLKGDKKNVSGIFRYEKTDNGWRPLDTFNKKGVFNKSRYN